jgi:hypothetical protein
MLAGDLLEGTVLLGQGEPVALGTDRGGEPRGGQRVGELLEPAGQVGCGDRLAESGDLTLQPPAQERAQSVTPLLVGEEGERLRGEAIVALREQPTGLVRERVARGGTAPRLAHGPGSHETLVLEHPEVATGGHLGDAEVAGELGDPGLAVAAQQLDDRGPGLTEPSSVAPANASRSRWRGAARCSQGSGGSRGRGDDFLNISVEERVRGGHPGRKPPPVGPRSRRPARAVPTTGSRSPGVRLAQSRRPAPPRRRVVGRLPRHSGTCRWGPGVLPVAPGPSAPRRSRGEQWQAGAAPAIDTTSSRTYGGPASSPQRSVSRSDRWVTTESTPHGARTV